MSVFVDIFTRLRLKFFSADKPIYFYFFGLLLTFFISLVIFSENLLDLFNNRVILAGDGAFTGYQLKLLQESNFLEIFSRDLNSNNFGWPFGSNFGHYPTGNLFELIIIKFIFLISNSITPAHIIHIFAISKVLLIFTTSFWCLRKLQLPNTFVLIGSIIFCFSSFNLIRSEGHFFLGFTWIVPIGIYCLITITSNLFDSNQIKPQNFHRSIFILGLISGLSTLYYAFYFLFLAFLLLILVIIKNLFVFYTNSKETLGLKFKKIISDTLNLLIFVTSILIGLAIQLIPALINKWSNISLASSSSRGSYTELFLYGGTIESLFYDFNKFMVRAFLNRPDIQNFLYSRISWESAQVGALAGLILFMLIILAVMKFINYKFFIFEVIFKESKSRGSILLLTITLLLYFPTMVSAFFFKLIPEIRVFGRFSVIISFLTILIMLFTIFHSQFSGVTKSLILSIALLIGLVDAYSFNIARPTSAQIAQSADTLQDQRTFTLQNLEERYTRDCAITVIPLVPFPEFDNPSDNNIDYAQFDLLLADNSYFKWGVGTFKNTVENKIYENLYSQQPNFIRASLLFSLNYLKATGMCGVVLDRSLMTNDENVEFETLQQSNNLQKNNCISDLGGEKFKKLSRYFSFDFLNTKCILPNLETARDFYNHIINNKLIWKNDSPYGKKYINGLQYFDYRNEIKLIVRPTENVDQTSFKIYIDSNTSDKKLEICVKVNKSYDKCQFAERKNNNFFEIKLRLFFEVNQIYDVRLRFGGTEQNFNNWAVLPSV